MNIKFTKQDIVIINIILILSACSLLPSASMGVTIIEVALLITFAYVYAVSIRHFGLFSVESLFLFSLMLFTFIRIFLSIFGLDDFRNGVVSIKNFRWDDEIAITAIFYYIVFLLIYLVIVLKRNTVSLFNYEEQGNYYQYSDSLLRLAKIVFYITAPATAFYYFLFALRVRSIGYTAIYNGEVNVSFTGVVGLLFNLISTLFDISYYVICWSETEKNNFIRVSIVFLIVQYIHLLQGSRAGAVSATLFFLFYLNKFYNAKIKKGWIVLGILVGLPLISIITYTRSGISYSGLGIFQILGSFFKSTSNAINVLGFYMHNKNALRGNRIPYVFESLIRLYLVIRYPSLMNRQSVELIKIRPNLNHRLSYFISPSRYLSGYAIGNNFMAELSEYGIIEVVLGSIVACLLIRYFSTNVKRSSYLKFMSFEFFTHIIIMPRSELFYDTYSLAKYSVVYLLICLLINRGTVSVKPSKEKA